MEKADDCTKCNGKGEMFVKTFSGAVYEVPCDKCHGSGKLFDIPDTVIQEYEDDKERIRMQSGGHFEC